MYSYSIIEHRGKNMENLMFCLNATIPVFITMFFGLFFRRIGLFDTAFLSKMNKFVFVAALPVLLFEDISTTDFIKAWDAKFVVFCFCATLISILISIGLSYKLKDKNIQGEFVQASYRSSAAILGIAFIQNIYGDAGMAPLMIVATVPLYNIMAVIVLSLLHPNRGRMSKHLLFQTLKDIAQNPIILGILVGILWSVLKIPQPVIMQKSLHNVGALATPLGLMAMGGSFTVSDLRSNIKPAAVCTFMKLIVFVALFLPLAIYLGFTNDKLVAILVMLGSATTVSCFIMAKNMGFEGSLSSSVVMMTTLCSAFTLTLWLFVIKSAGFL